MISVEKPGTPYELVHHGVKGMHWGIRKERTSDPELKRQAKSALKEKSKPILDIRISQMFNVDPLTMNDYNQMSTRRTSIPAGQSLYRLTRNPNDTTFTGRTYVTTNKKDAEIYRGLLPSQRLFEPLKKSDYKPHFELALKTKTMLKGPS